MFPRSTALRACLPTLLLVSGLATSPVVAQTLQAHYPFLTDALDATGNYGPASLVGNPVPPSPPANGVCVNGIYRYSAGGQDVRTPLISSLTTSDFQFEVEFNLAALPAVRAPILMGGNSYRWLGIYVDASGNAGLKHNNSNLAWSTTTLIPGRWYTGTVKYEGGVVQLLIDGGLAMQLNVGPLNDGNNLNFTTNDFASGFSHNGCIRNLKIWNDANLTFHRAPTGCGALTITEGGTGVPGGSVSLSVSGASSSAIMFGFTAANLPLCPNSTCVLGLVQVGALVGPSATLPIPATVQPGVSVAFQGVAIASGGCNFGSGLTVAVTDTIHLVVQ